MINLPKFKIGNVEINLIQGGMGVVISGENLASAVANCGGAGIIASVGIGGAKHYLGEYAEANATALKDEIRTARRKSEGVIGVNVMYALSDHDSLIRAAVEEGVDLIISGAGIAKNLPKTVGDNDVNLVAIVNGVRVAKVITKTWKKYSKIPDAFIVEGPEAGGHLAYNYEDLINGTAPKLEDIAREVIEFANTQFDNPVPVIVAGGIYTGQDIRKARSWGAAGVQMATRFVTTLECDADDGFKQMYVGANEEDLVIIQSPVGMPGRAIRTPFLDRVMDGEKIAFGCGYQCLKTCKLNESPYCIAEALDGAQQGDFNKGFAFAGANAYRATPETCLDANGKFITVETLMRNISDEYNSSQIL